MCGIVGVIARDPVSIGVVERMRDTLAHRGPDHAGLWHSSDGCVVLGHRRLAIIDLDERANQPMQSRDGRFVITFNGEIYNYRAVRTQLEDDGVAFQTSSDTEVLLEAYRRWGEEGLDHISGMFAFAIWDTERRRLFAARDRAGEKPFYYADLGGTFLFASEVKALAAWPRVARELDFEALIDYLTLGFIADPKSIWRGVRKLAPAHTLSVDWSPLKGPLAGSPERYWALSFEPRRSRIEPGEIRDGLVAAAREMAVSDVAIGTFLSGGVDSSTVTAALRLAGHDVRTFTMGFAEQSYDERGWARQVAERYQTEHVERTIESSDVVGVVDDLVWHYDEPFNDYSCFPTYYLCREARRSITVALSGDGADELFAGYGKYRRLVRRRELAGVLPVSVIRPAAAIAEQVLREGSRWRRTFAQYGLPSPRMLADMLCHGLRTDLLRQVARGPLATALRHYGPDQLVEQVLTAAPPKEVGLVNAMRHLDFSLTLPSGMLVKVDRASMAVSLEVRPVFLHRRVMELAAAIPADALVTRHAGKLALKAAVRPWLPDAVLDRPKQGFAMPLPEWMRGDGPAAGAIRGGTTSTVIGEWLDLDRMRQLAALQAAGAASLTTAVHSVFMLDRWCHRWLQN